MEFKLEAVVNEDIIRRFFCRYDIEHSVHFTLDKAGSIVCSKISMGSETKPSNIYITPGDPQSGIYVVNGVNENLTLKANNCEELFVILEHEGLIPKHALF